MRGSNTARDGLSGPCDAECEMQNARRKISGRALRRAQRQLAKRVHQEAVAIFAWVPRDARSSRPTTPAFGAGVAVTVRAEGSPRAHMPGSALMFPFGLGPWSACGNGPLICSSCHLFIRPSR